MGREPYAEDGRHLSSDHVTGKCSKARAFHQSFPQYSKTPLAKLDHMAEYLGLGGLFVRMNPTASAECLQGAGGSFAMANYIAKQTHRDVSELPTQSSPLRSSEKNSGRPHSSPQRTAITSAALPGRQTGWDRNL